VYSELIGKTLYARLDVKPHVIVVDQDPLLTLREHVSVPLACLVDEATAAGDLPDVTRLTLGRQSVRFHADFPADQDHVREQLANSLPSDADLREPLDRVSEALRETLRAGAVA
jgi:hypothetical protein